MDPDVASTVCLPSASTGAGATERTAESSSTATAETPTGAIVLVDDHDDHGDDHHGYLYVVDAHFDCLDDYGNVGDVNGCFDCLDDHGDVSDGDGHNDCVDDHHGCLHVVVDVRLDCLAVHRRWRSNPRARATRA